jgi:cobyrinic acid a,c-diamide synthase
VALALMAGFKKAGLQVQAFKVGPDYIDPGYHQFVTGRPSHNLDDWMMGERAVCQVFAQTTTTCDIAVIEGVMGLFDGLSASDDSGSTAGIAKLLDVPVILVVDAGKMARSVAAMIKGYQTLDPDVRIVGIILNKVASEHHYEILKTAIEWYNHIPVLGALMRNQKIVIPQRHLGLTTASENPAFLACLQELEQLSSTASQQRIGSIHLPSVLEAAGGTIDGEIRVLQTDTTAALLRQTEDRDQCPVRLAYAYDRAFQFYYQANLDELRRLGAELVPFSPLDDAKLPDDIYGLYLGGGFPEVYAAQLQDNRSMRDAVRKATASGLPTYAECGGLMFLSESIKDLRGEIYEMVGVIPGSIVMTERLVNFGYCENRLLRDCFLGKNGEQFRGHEFHHSKWDGEGGELSVHQVVKTSRGFARLEGYGHHQLLASYVHCHFLSYPQRAEAFVAAARNYKTYQQKVMVHGL